MLSRKKREALECVRALIDNNSERFICYALDKVAKQRPHLAETCEYLHQYIMQKLEGWMSLGNWIRMVKGRYLSPEQFRECRLAWLDWMLGEKLPEVSLGIDGRMDTFHGNDD